MTEPCTARPGHGCCRRAAPCAMPARLGCGHSRVRLAPVRWVVHAVGPKYRGRPEAADLLVPAYQAGLARADEVGARSIAFPSISTVRYATRWTWRRRCAAAPNKLEEVVLVAYNDEVAEHWRAALEAWPPMQR